MNKLIQAKKLLTQVWGYDSFREGQEELIQNILDNQNVIGLLPTGVGKSLIYQLPALVLDGVCLVVSPLIALMNDQIQKLKELNINAVAIHSGLTRREIDFILDNCIYGRVKLLFVSPERINTHLFRARVEQMKLSFLAVDEAHCISQWGHDFRPSYQNISLIRDIHPNLKTVALTATANGKVVSDIKKQLALSEVKVIRRSFKRENLHIRMLETDNKLHLLKSILSKHKGTSIIYVRHRKTAFELHQTLNEDFKSAYYHAGLTHKERNEKQTAWIDGDVRLMIATNAFGMGIDKSNVRLIVHYGLSPTIEEYYQEIGRAGRDGKKAMAYLLFNQNDVERLLTNHKKSYPSIENIRKAYSLIHNYYELPVGEGEFHSYEFQIGHFAKYCNASIAVVYRLLKQLEKLNFIKISRGFKQSEKIKLKIDRNRVFELSDEYKQVAVYLLRNIENIISSTTKVNTKKIANDLELEHEQVLKRLKEMDQLKLVRFSGSTETPQMTFLQNRFALQNLHIDEASYNDRRDDELNKNNSLIKLLKTKECRLKDILLYFDEEDVEACGMCDNCLMQSINLTDLEATLKRTMTNGQTINSLVETFDFHERKSMLELVNKMVDAQKINIIDKKIFLK